MQAAGNAAVQAECPSRGPPVDEQCAASGSRRHLPGTGLMTIATQSGMELHFAASCAGWSTRMHCFSSGLQAGRYALTDLWGDLIMSPEAGLWP